jgi:hypothetical protein
MAGIACIEARTPSAIEAAEANYKEPVSVLFSHSQLWCDEMIPGIKIPMGDHEYEVPPLTLGQLRRLQARTADLSSGDAGKVMMAICEIVQAAMSRNYPNITVENVEELIDLGNREKVIAAVLGSSGLKLGEAMAVTSVGGPSMDLSPPPADTHIQ